MDECVAACQYAQHLCVMSAVAREGTGVSETEFIGGSLLSCVVLGTDVRPSPSALHL